VFIEYLDRMIRNLQRGGVKIISQPKLREWGYIAVVEDSDERRIELTDIEN
jgi:predicted enzyme related to lactoylglutathione lyase